MELSTLPRRQSPLLTPPFTNKCPHSLWTVSIKCPSLFQGVNIYNQIILARWLPWENAWLCRPASWPPPEQGQECLPLQGGKPPAGQHLNPFVGASPHTPSHKPKLEPAMPHKGADHPHGGVTPSWPQRRLSRDGVPVAVIPQPALHSSAAMAIKKKSHGMAWPRGEIA